MAPETRGLAPNLQADLQPMESNEHLFWMRPSKNSSKRIPCDTRYRKPITWVAPRIDSLDNLVEQWFRFWAQFQFSRHVIDIKRGGIFSRISHFEEAAESDHVSRGPQSEPHNSWLAFLGPDVDSTTMLESYPISVVDPFIRSKNVTRSINAQALSMFQDECAGAVELLKLGTDMTDIIDGFDMLKQDYNGHWTARLQRSRKDLHGQTATVLKAHAKEVRLMIFLTGTLFHDGHLNRLMFCNTRTQNVMTYLLMDRSHHQTPSSRLI